MDATHRTAANSDARKRNALRDSLVVAGDVEALAEVLDRHVTDAAFESGCRLSCGYDGDDLTSHMARAVLASDWLAARLAAAEQRGRDEVLADVEALADAARSMKPRPDHWGYVWADDLRAIVARYRDGGQ